MLADNPDLARKNPGLLTPFMKKTDPLPLAKKKPAQEDSEGEGKKRNKYRNQKVYEYEDGYTDYYPSIETHGKLVYVFDSIKEHKRWQELKLLEKSGAISMLKRQVPLRIQESFVYRGEKIREIVYKADFMYSQNGETVVEDVKGLDKETGEHITTKDFKLKWKLLKHAYPDYDFRIF